jgi:hypothetical protein
MIDYCNGKFTPVEDWLWKHCDNADDEFNENKRYETNNYPMELTTESRIKKIKIYYINNKKVQIIQANGFTNYESIKNMIINTFDFSFLMNIFDGEYVYIHDIDAIITKTCIHNKINRLEEKFGKNIYLSDVAHIPVLSSESYYDENNLHSITIHYRCLKYIERGYTIKNYTNPDAIYIAVIETKSGGYGLCDNTCYLNHDAITYLIGNNLTKYYHLLTKKEIDTSFDERIILTRSTFLVEDEIDKELENKKKDITDIYK